MNTCETCKHWSEHERSYTGLVINECKIVPMPYEATEWSEDGDGRVLKEEYKNAKAFVQDGSDYAAYLLTCKDFGCNQWEAKE